MGSILFMPFWVSVILGIVGMIYFPFFLEAVFLFLLADVLYGIPEPKFFNIALVSFGLALICFILLEFLKKKLRLHSKQRNDFQKI